MFEIISSIEPRVDAYSFALDSAERQEPNLAQWELLDGKLIVRNVVSAQLLHFSPKVKNHRNEEAILVAPGGAMMLLAIDHEGYAVARALAELGFQAFVLQYRVNPTERDAQLFRKHCEEFIAETIDSPGNFRSKLELTNARNDLQSALKVLRSNPSPFNCNLSKIHFLGFSAGGQLGLDSLEQNLPSVLASMACLYASLNPLHFLSARQPRSESIPPLFTAIANDDPFFARQGFGLIEQWQQLGQVVQLHLFSDGGHGFGIEKRGAASDDWFELYCAWLDRLNPTGKKNEPQRTNG
jgi:acetyl esterase/lipase